MPQLDPTWFASQLFWLAISFVTLYVVLSRLVLPPLQETLARRAGTIVSDIERAQSLKSEAETARQEYERTLAEARARSQKMISDTLLAQKAKAEETARRLDSEIAKKAADAEAEINASKQSLLQALTPTAAELSSLIVEKLTQKTPDEKAVQSAVSELSKSRNRG